ncbi:MAG TPA: TRAFs-binding domain-containing protein [Methylovirgula sp.]|nr:TRAFs-binding domain-containing protein [Methylovirgula sp.]
MSHRAVCFVIMPFGRKPDASGREIDFDLVYKEIIEPGVGDAGFEPVRADEELHAGLIHKAMYERLMLSEYAVADLTIFNPNVYYELGVRHAVRPQTTVLMAADASRLPFDVGHLRTLPYRLDEKGRPKEAAAARAALAKRLDDCKRHGEADSPLFKLLDGFKPAEIEHAKTDTFRQQVTYSRELKAKLAAARALKKNEGVAALDLIRAELGDISTVEAGVAIDLYLSYRAASAWERMIELYNAFDPVLRHSAMAREQYAMALNRIGHRDEAEKVLSDLIEERGASSETYGLLGRVYKDRWDAAKKTEDFAAPAWAEKAIEAYLRGFEADWRDAYPGVNAVTLIALTDPENPRIAQLAPVVRYSVERKIARGQADYWDYATLVELAVIAGQLNEAMKLLPNALVHLKEGWNAETTARNLSLIRDAWRDAGKPDAQLSKIIAALEARAG